MTAPSDPIFISPMPSLDMSRVKDEKGVKAKVKQLLNHFGYFHWMPGANGYGTQGVSDHLAIKDGVFLAIECKFGYNKPKPVQKAFAAQIIANDAYAFCVNERNIQHLAWWLESFGITQDLSRQALAAGRNPEEAVPAEHGARLLNAIAALTEPFGEVS